MVARSLLLLAALAGPLPAQVPPGHALLAHTTAATGTGLSVVDSITGTVTPIAAVGLPQGTLTRAALGSSSAALWLGGQAQSGATTLGSAVLSGLTLTSYAVLTSALQGTVTGIAALPSGVLACTSQTIYLVAAGGSVTTLVPTTSPLGCVDLALGNGVVAVLASDPSTAAASIWTLSATSPRLPTLHRLGLNAATSIAWAPDKAGYLVGDRAGTLWLVDATRFSASLWLATGLGAIDALGLDSDRQTHLVAVGASLHELAGQTLTRAIALPGTSAVSDLDWAPYQSAFTALGKGCPGASGLPPALGALGRPFPGNAAFALAVSLAPPSTLAVLVLGTTQASIDLKSLGMPGCTLLLLPLLPIATATGPTGSALWPLAVPASSSLPGSSLLAQAAVVDPAANARGVVVSNAGRLDF